MKKPVLLFLAGAALFAAGYWVRSLSAEPEGRRPGSGLVAPAARERAVSDQADQAKVGAADSAVRAFLPGRPFAKGHAMEWLLSLVPSLGGDRRGNAISMMNFTQVFLTMDDSAVREALAAVQELSALEDAKDPARRRNPNGDGKLDVLMMLAMVRLAQTNPEEAMATLKQNFNHNDGTTRMLVFGRLAADDPQHAEQMALSLDDKQQRDALQAVMYSFVNQDPQAALVFAGRHPGVLNDDDRERILESWVKRDPQPAMAAAVHEMAKSRNPELVRQTIEEWYKFEPAAAAQWASAHEGAGSVVARAIILERRAHDEPEAVVQEYAALQQTSADPRELVRLTSALADSLAGKDVGAAREWAQNLPAGELRDRALQQVAGQWVKSDAPAASEWIRTLPAGQLRDGAARNLAAVLSRRDPASAFEWARSIENKNQREDAVRSVMQNWSEQDPDAAKAAVESLPEEMRPAH